MSVPLGTGRPHDMSVRRERDPVRELPGVASAVAAQPAEAVCSHSRVTGLGAPQCLRVSSLGDLLRRDARMKREPWQPVGGGWGVTSAAAPEFIYRLARAPFIPE